MQNPDLYQAIIERYSVRRYQQQPLDAGLAKQVQRILDRVTPIQPDGRISFLVLDDLKRSDLIAAQGPYGRFISSSQVLIPYTTHAVEPLVEIGFQTQQVVTRMFALGIGSCYIGTANREQRLIRHFQLPEDSALGAAVMYGLPEEDETRTLANYFRKPGHRTVRQPMSQMLYAEDFDYPAEPTGKLAEILSAAQRAPSAVNKQPWRLVCQAGMLYLYVDPGVYPFVLRQKGRLTYAYHDAGIAMANLSLALEAHGLSSSWKLAAETGQERFPHSPDGYEPVASIDLSMVDGALEPSA
ncbi:MAG: hypothetical protein JW750_06800 [Anaerolineaceae bacterium]|nr:hypothetical protein [Anaerolineaceae bacterium]